MHTCDFLNLERVVNKLRPPGACTMRKRHSLVESSRNLVPPAGLFRCRGILHAVILGVIWQTFSRDEKVSCDGCSRKALPSVPSKLVPLRCLRNAMHQGLHVVLTRPLGLGPGTRSFKAWLAAMCGHGSSTKVLRASL